ncbi:Acg family FMN-binding oxidoreductase [Gordonia sp. NPDC003424]
MLKGIGVGAIAVVVVGGGAVSVRAASNGVFDSGEGTPYDLWSSWQSQPGLRGVVAAGVLAANPHNTQPWIFAIGADGIDLYADPTRVMPIMDSDGRERMVGFGCAIENMVVAARARGLAAEVTPIPDGSPGHVAHIGVRPAVSAPTEDLAPAVGRRHSNRGPYASRPVSAEILAALANHPAGTFGTVDPEIVWITDPDRRRALGALYVEATQAIIDDTPMSEESFAWFRNNRGDIDAHRDGLTLDAQGMGSAMLAAAKILPAQSRTSGDEFWLKTTREVHTATAAAYGIVRVPDVGDPESRLAAGRLIQHVHLAATAQGLAMQHMNQITERIARDAAQGHPDRFGSRWSAIIGIPQSRALVSLRIGYPQHSAGLSPRRALSDVTRAS